MKAWAFVVVALSVVVPARAQDISKERLSLEEAIAVALSSEPRTRAAAAELDLARGMRVQAGLRSNPTVSFEFRKEPGGTDAAADLSIEWPLELFRRGPRVGASDADVQVAEHEASEVRRQLAGDVATAYGEVAAANRQLAITDQVIGAVSNQLELLRSRAAEGSTPPLDRDMVDVDLRRLQADRVAEAGRAERALLRLKRSIGVSAEASLQVTQTLEELVAGDVNRSGAVAGVSTRADVRAAEARVQAADERIEAVRGEGRPDVTVIGSYMRMDAGFPQRAFNAAGGTERVRGQFNYLSAGVMVTLPLSNRQQGNLAATTATRQVAEAAAESARLTAALEVAEARVRYDHARRAVALYDDGIRPLAQRNLDVVRETYGLGRATVLDVLVEQRRYLETERAYTEALNEAYASGISLRRAGDLR